jgi:hypothetical protein
MELSKDRWYALCEKHKGWVSGLEGVMNPYQGDDTCDYVGRNRKVRCGQGAVWEFYTGGELGA